MEFLDRSDYDGMPAYKYVLGKKFLDNGTIYPENKCYCNGDCIPSGLYNVSACRYGTPSFVSLPHFLNADPIYLEEVEGLSPEESKHEFFMKLEPETGTPLEVRARAQINMLLHRVPKIS